MNINREQLWLPRWLKYSLTASATALTIISFYGGISLGLGGDWLSFYTAGYAFIHDQMHHLYDLAAVQSWQANLIKDSLVAYLYAPAYSLFFIPLAVLPHIVARLLWLAVGILSCIIAVRLSARWTMLRFEISVLGLMAFAPLGFALAVGQISPITLLLFSAVIALSWQGKNGWLPGFLAGLALYKPQLLIPIVFFWVIKHHWRTLAGFATAATGIAATSFFISPAATWDYISKPTYLIEVIEKVTRSGANAALFAISPLLGIFVGVIVLLALFIVFRHPLNRYSLAMLWLAPIFTTPHLGIYDLLLLALPISILIPVVPKDRMIQVSLLFIWTTPIAFIFTRNIYPVMFSALCLFILCYIRSRSSESIANENPRSSILPPMR